MLHEVRGTTREVVRQQLTNLLVLLNRALRDEGMAEWQSGRLLWPFIRAFPPKERRELERHLGAALRAEDPLAAIYEYAPAETGQEESVLAAALPADPLDSQDWEPEANVGTFTHQSYTVDCSHVDNNPFFRKNTTHIRHNSFRRQPYRLAHK